MDILLEDEEDSSDEEYYPDEDEEDETAEEVRKSYSFMISFSEETSNIKKKVLFENTFEAKVWVLNFLIVCDTQTILESDMDSIASSPRISRRARSCTPIEVSEVDEERSNSPQMVHTTVVQHSPAYSQ